MRIPKQSYVLLLSIILGCDTLLKPDYRDIGTFKTRLQAQNGAIKFFVKNYVSLPKDQYYKVKYAVSDAPLNEQRENALWYNKTSAELIYEVDVASGPVCRWREVSLTVLEQASSSINSLSKVDSLAKPNQSFRECQ